MRCKFAEPGTFDEHFDQNLILGVKWDKTADPTLVRTDDAVGLIAQAGLDSESVLNDFDSMPIFGEMREVVDHFGNVFIRIPKFYIRKIDEDNLKSWQVSKRKREGYYLPACFYDYANGQELPFIDIGKYPASLGVENKLESKPDVHPLVLTNIVNFRNYARNNNINGIRGYQQLDIHTYDLLQTLMFIEFATLHMQGVMAGFSTGQYSNDHVAIITESETNRIILASNYASGYRVGQSIGIGTVNSSNSVSGGSRLITEITDYDGEHTAIHFDGDPLDITEGDVVANRGWVNGFSKNIAASSGSIVANDGKYPCVYRGIENPYANIWQFVDGVNITEHQAWVCADASQYISNLFAAPYEKLGYSNHGANGYVTQMGFDPEYPFAGFPIAVGGSTSTYYCDYYYQATGTRIARVGGGWPDGGYAGPSYWSLSYASSNASVTFGGRLLKKPL